mgnify:CR=1 FL=1
MKTIGLTGSIGMGKSTTAAMFREAGIPVYDADAAVHDLYDEGGAAVGPVGEAFPGVVRDGRVDREELRKRVLGQPEELKRLNAIVHPPVRATIAERVAGLVGTDAVVVLEIPLLVESGRSYGASQVIVVDCPEEVAVRRLVEGRGMEEADARRRIAAQVSRSDRLAAADVVIDNAGSVADLRRQVDAAWDDLARE